MALILISRIFNYELRKSSNILSACKIFSIPSANLTSKENRDPTIKKPWPWPYQKWKFRFVYGYFEGTVKRLDENSKIIVVDGNIGAGKSKFAKELAEAFDFVYMPEPTMDKWYITPYGYDLREIDHLFPPSYKCCDINTFYKNPHHHNVAKFQLRMYFFRLENYIDALAHVLNTGQGVVLERSAYSDFVFVETMYKFGYIGKDAYQQIKDAQEYTLDELLRPHLVIYLDISPEVALQRIKERNNPVEVNSKVLTKEYLETIEYYYKQHYLKNMEKYSELLVYDWSNFGDVEVVVEDIERINFERFTEYDRKLMDWRKEDDWEWNYFRRQYTCFKTYLMRYGVLFRPEVSDLMHPGDEVVEWKEIISKIPGEKYEEGFNPMAGDNVWFKTKHRSYRDINYFKY